MDRRRGFTIVELVITLTVMAILMTLAVANMRSTQTLARDDERKSDIEAVASRLESLYVKGFPAPSVVTPGIYPTTVHFSGNLSTIFQDIPEGTLIDPFKTTAAESFFVATNTLTGTDSTQPSTLVQPAPSSATPYVYQPIADDGTLCNGSTTPRSLCRQFNLYYWTEAGDDPIVKVESRRR